MNVRFSFRTVVIWLLFVLCITSCARAESYKNPPQDLQISDLVGTWEAHYGSNRVDRLVIREDGLYKQIYEDPLEDYYFETDWKNIQLEFLSNDNIYIHFEKARYFNEGVRLGELDGLGEPCPSELPGCYSESHPREFYDPYTNDFVTMRNQLILTIRLDDTKFVFHHLWTTQDRGFAIFGGQTEVFRKVKNQNE